MKREYVIPDLLASLTADALFADRPRNRARAQATPALPASSEPSAMQRLSRWFKRAPVAAIDSPAPAAARHTLTDDWAGGWYARTRLLQAATLAQHAATAAAAEEPAATGGITSDGVPYVGAKAAS